MSNNVMNSKADKAVESVLTPLQDALDTLNEVRNNPSVSEDRKREIEQITEWIDNAITSVDLYISAERD